MSSSSRVPPLLVPYLDVNSESSLIFLTSVINASTNWLLLRFLYASASSTSTGRSTLRSERNVGTKIILVSFMRDWDFWRDGARRAGLNLTNMEAQGSLVYIDGLMGLSENHREVEGHLNTKWKRVLLRDLGLETLEETVNSCIHVMKTHTEERILLVLDGLDMLLAITEVDAQALTDMVMGWREQVFSTIVTTSADSALLRSPNSPLEVNHTAFVTGLAHQASFVMSLRLLSTGAAKDVSGVMLITRGAEADEQDTSETVVEEKELLYWIAGDGNVKVFERGTVAQ